MLHNCIKFRYMVNDNVSERLMLLDYEFHTVFTYKTITHISFTSHHGPIKKHISSSKRRTLLYE